MVGSSTVTIDRYSYGIENCKIYEWGEGKSLKIGSFCSIANGVEFYLGGEHQLDTFTTYPFGHIYTEYLPFEANPNHPLSKGDIVIGNDVWIGSNVTILSGVNIGHGAVLGANSLITKDVNPYCIVAGNPAKVIKQRFNYSIIEELLNLSWWNLDIEKISKIIPLLLEYPTIKRIRTINERIKEH